MSFPQIDVLIVGAGISGLVAALQIQKKEPNLNLIIVEAENVIGGQLQFCKFGELGGKWITEDQYQIYTLCTNLGIKMKKRHINRRVFKYHCDLENGLFGRLAVFETERFIKEIDLRAQYIKNKGKSKDTKSMEKFIRSKVFFEQSRTFMRLIVRLVTGVEACNITLVEFLNIVDSNNGLSGLLTLITGTSNSLYEISSKHLLTCIEKEIGYEKIFIGTKITNISHYDNYILASDISNNQFCCSILIAAIPWPQIQQIVFDPPLPKEMRIPIFENKNMITAYIINYPEGYWLKNGHTGNLITFDPSIIGYQLNSTTLGGVVIHEEDFEEILKPLVLNKLADLYGYEMKIPSHWIQKSWEQSILLNLPQTTPWNRIIFASTCSGTIYRGRLSGAVQSGMRAAVLALLQIRPQNITWLDINEFQKANVVFSRISWFKVFRSSINLYNSGYYFCLVNSLIFIYVFRNIYLKRSSVF